MNSGTNIISAIRYKAHNICGWSAERFQTLKTTAPPGGRINVSPNPAENDIVITLDPGSPVPLPEDVVIQVMDLNGRVLLEKQVTSNNQQIDLSNFAQGLYIVKSTYLGEVEHHRVYLTPR